VLPLSGESVDRNLWSAGHAHDPAKRNRSTRADEAMRRGQGSFRRHRPRTTRAQSRGRHSSKATHRGAGRVRARDAGNTAPAWAVKRTPKPSMKETANRSSARNNEWIDDIQIRQIDRLDEIAVDRERGKQPGVVERVRSHNSRPSMSQDHLPSASALCSASTKAARIRNASAVPLASPFSKSSCACPMVLVTWARHSTGAVLARAKL
jgi:hypothetical protein